MGVIFDIGVLVYFIYKSIVSGREYSNITSAQKSKPTKEAKELRNIFICNIAGAVIFFVVVMRNDI